MTVLAMARTVDHQRREAIVRRAADHLLERGVVAVSLRELAAAVGVSPRMLVHHFGSREELVSRALREARTGQRDAFAARLAPQPERPYADVPTDAWRWFAMDEARPYLRLFGQLYALAQAPDSPHADFLRESVVDWLPTIEHGFAADGADPATARELSTLTLAVIRRLLQDANAIGDQERVSAAFERYAALLHEPHQPAPDRLYGGHTAQTKPIPYGTGAALAERRRASRLVPVRLSQGRSLGGLGSVRISI